jgi:hypothetical protein
MLTTGRTNRCREYDSPMDKAHTLRVRPRAGSNQVPK